jgi:hypothetical protein
MVELRINDLGPGWEGADVALAAVQADLSRTVHDAPQLMLLWYDDEETGTRQAYVGKSADWYYGADGPFELEREYHSAVVSIAGQVQDAIADTLLGYYAFWPHCPHHEYPLHISSDNAGAYTWVCSRDGGHAVSEVGRLPLPSQ